MGHVDDTALGLIIMLLGSESIDITIDYLLFCDTVSMKILFECFPKLSYGDRDHDVQ
jgi:hypothetical protein